MQMVGHRLASAAAESAELGERLRVAGARAERGEQTARAREQVWVGGWMGEAGGWVDG